jgi:hypothetical protein
VVRVRAGIAATGEHVREVAAAVRQVQAGEVPCRILADIRDLKSANADARSVGVSPEVRALIEKLALLVESPVSRMLGSAYLFVVGSTPTMRIFSSEREATSWLEG